MLKCIFWKRKRMKSRRKCLSLCSVAGIFFFFLGGRSHLSDPKFRRREGTALGQVLLFSSFLLFFFLLLDILVGARGGKKPLPVVPSGHGQVFLISDETTTRRRGRIFILRKHCYTILFSLNSVKFSTLFSQIDLKRMLKNEYSLPFYFFFISRSTGGDLATQHS